MIRYRTRRLIPGLDAWVAEIVPADAPLPEVPAGWWVVRRPWWFPAPGRFFRRRPRRMAGK